MEEIIMQCITQVGFPIAACLGLALYIWYKDKSHNETVKNLVNSHKAESDKMTEALNNNTLAITKLLERLEK